MSVPSLPPGGFAPLRRLLTLLRRPALLFPLLFFTLYLMLGLFIFRDYGISYDEPAQIHIGSLNVQYLLGQDAGLLSDKDRFYGPVFEIFLFGLARLAGISKPSTLYHFRHLLTFLTFFAGVAGFYLLGRKIFQRWQFALLGSLLLILSPRIFENSFYNSKDIPLLVFFILSAYTLLVYLEKRSLPALLLHALACALVTDTRVIGALMPALTLALLPWDPWPAGASRPGRFQFLPHLVLFLLTWIPLVILFWPILWSDPLRNLLSAIREVSHFPWIGNVFYLGRWIPADQLPWHYLPVWILVSTPLLYTLGFLAGAPWLAGRLLLRWSRLAEREKQAAILLLAWFFAPLFSAIALKAVVYDSWRHFFFIYPAMLLIAVRAFERALDALLARLDRRPVLPLVLAAALCASLAIASLAFTALEMLRAHPYEQMVFIHLPGQDLSTLPDLFELDYWGLSYRAGLAYILKTDPAAQIPLAVETPPGAYNANLFSAADQQRLVYVDDPAQARYYLANFRFARSYPYADEVYAVTVGGGKILAVYKLK